MNNTFYIQGVTNIILIILSARLLTLSLILCFIISIFFSSHIYWIVDQWRSIYKHNGTGRHFAEFHQIASEVWMIQKSITDVLDIVQSCILVNISLSIELFYFLLEKIKGSQKELSVGNSKFQ